MDNQEQLELIRSMAERLERIEKRQKRARNRSIVIACIVVAALVVLAIFLTPRIMAAVASYNAAMAKIDQVSSVMEGVDPAKLKDALTSLGDVDFTALKTKLAEAEKLVDKLSALKVDDLNKVIESLKKTVEPLLGLLG